MEEGGLVPPGVPGSQTHRQQSREGGGGVILHRKPPECTAGAPSLVEFQINTKNNNNKSPKNRSKSRLRWEGPGPSAEQHSSP